MNLSVLSFAESNTLIIDVPKDKLESIERQTMENIIENEMDKIELATKKTNWGYAVVKVRVEANVECALEALQEAEGVVNTRLISDPYANIKVSFKPSMLDKSISNIILEKCNVNAEIIESKLRQ